MWIWLLLGAASAQDCPSIPERVEAAREAFEFAELERAIEALDEASAALTCQDRLVQRSTLLELFLFTAQVAFSLENDSRMNEALERAVAVDARPTARPAPPYSPELVARWDAIATRLARDQAEVRVTGQGTAYVDGREASASRPLRVARAPHLVQTPQAEGYRSQVVVVTSDTVIPMPGASASPMPAPRALRPAPLPAPSPLVPPSEPSDRGRTRRIAAGTASGVFAAISAFTLLSGVVSERSFSESGYDGPVVPFYDVPRGDPRYAQARQLIIENDARIINRLYATGYVTAAVSGALLTVAIVPPRRDR